MLYNHGNYVSSFAVQMRLLVGDHARRRMFERGITIDEVAEAVRKGRKWRERDELHASIRNIEVVYKMIDSDTFVITVHYR